MIFVLLAILLFLFFCYFGFRAAAYNTFIFWLLITLSIIIAYFISPKKTYIAPLSLGVYLALFVLFELSYFYGCGLTVWNENERVDSSYQWFDVYLDTGGKKTADLTEAYFKDSWLISPIIAMQDKYAAFFDELALKPGMHVLDVGCGYCQWIQYLKERGVSSVGLTISKDHVSYGISKGLDVRLQDICTLTKEYYDQFDAVTMLGSLEHFSKCYMSTPKRLAIYKNVFERAKKAIKLNSSSKRILFTMLHTYDHKWSFSDNIKLYILERHYSGRYPIEGEINSQKGQNVSLIHYSDKTEDYRWISMICPDHFGYFNIHWDLRKICYVPFMFLTDPFAIHKWLYHDCDIWMWSLGGTSKTPDPTRNRYSPVHLKWCVFQLAANN